MPENKEIKKSKLICHIVSFASAIGVMALLFMFVIVMFSHDTFDSSCIIATVLFACGTLGLSLLFGIVNRHYNDLIDKTFGVVTDEDREKCKELSEQADSIACKWHYDFFVDLFEKFAENEKSYKFLVKNQLAGLSRNPHKHRVENIELFHELKERINSSPDKDLEKNAKFNAFTLELIELLERNHVDI